jgi:hypothetical protein
MQVFSGTSFDIHCTQNRILPEECISEQDGVVNLADQDDLLEAELKKMHDLENKPPDEKIEDTSDVEQM